MNGVTPYWDQNVLRIKKTNILKELWHYSFGIEYSPVGTWLQLKQNLLV